MRASPLSFARRVNPSHLTAVTQKPRPTQNDVTAYGGRWLVAAKS